ncbi:MAG: complex I subunit 1 family protein [Bacteroidia bacterium]|nr:complex I subunit 1 family protein [Bacteroidia bacterium]
MLLPLVIATLLFISGFTLLAVWAERKVSAYIQDRLGPMETGPFGLFQTLADVIKLVLKESIIPAAADRALFVWAPVVIFVSVLAGFAALPWGPGVIGSRLDIGLLFILGVVAIDVIGMLMAGWGASNKYALLGAARAVAQIISYEIPAAAALLAAVLLFGTLDLQQLTAAQGIYAAEPVRLWGLWDLSGTGGFPAWAVVRYPHLLLAWLIYFIASLAECNRAPFDIPEAESELVAGFHVEYGGFRFALVMLSEYGKMLLVSLIGAVVFWGGWNTPLPNLPGLPLADWTTGAPGTAAGLLWGLCWLLAKAFFFVFLQMWIRWTYPRVRVDQLMQLGWKYLTPAALLLLALSAVWRVAETGGW